MASDTLLTIDKIEGESLDVIIKNAIEIAGWGGGLSNPSSFGSGSGGGVGKSQFQDLHFSL